MSPDNPRDLNHSSQPDNHQSSSHNGALLRILGVGFGLALGWLLSLILVHVINRQSFHWSMDMQVPWLILAALGSALVAAASLTAVWSGRRAMSNAVVSAVREDW